MDFTISALRDTLEHRQLQSPDILFWFEHTAFPMLATRKHPRDYEPSQWDQLKERKLISITVGFTAKGDALCNGFEPVNFKPPLIDTVHQIRLVRFIPNSGEISVAIPGEEAAEPDDRTITCKMKSTVVVAKIGNACEVERESCIEGLFNLQVTLPQRKIEFT
jgi:hypothetical protein